MSQKIILWSIAAEPLFLAAVAWFLRRTGTLLPAGTMKSGDLTLLIFAVITLSLVWAGFQFASGRFVPKTPGIKPAPLLIPIGHWIVAVALTTAPGIMGFIHHILFGADWVLLVFNLGAFVLAARHVLNFASDRQ